MAARFYCTSDLGIGEVVLEGTEAHHLAQVTRHQINDPVTLFNGDGSEYPGEIVSISRKQVAIRILRIETPLRELPIPVHVGCALPKGDRCDFLLEKMTELGVTDFTPLQTARSIVQPREAKIEKLQRLVIEASKQCGRNRLMRVHPLMAFERWCAVGEASSQRWIAHPGAASLPRTMPLGQGAWQFAIGPEGGFSEEEMVIAHQLGWQSFSLGPRILRIETAAITVAALVGQLFGNA